MDFFKRCPDKTGGCVPFGPSDSSSYEDYMKKRAWYMEMLQHAKDGCIDVEMDDCCLRGFGTVEERKFYREEWLKAHADYCQCNAGGGRPELYEKMGYTKEEWEDLKNV